jgi:hypothetical protein
MDLMGERVGKGLKARPSRRIKKGNGGNPERPRREHANALPEHFSGKIPNADVPGQAEFRKHFGPCFSGVGPWVRVVYPVFPMVVIRVELLSVKLAAVEGAVAKQGLGVE